MAEKEALKPCPTCGRAVKIRQEWHYNKTRLTIHCKCGHHVATEWSYRGEPLAQTREEFSAAWNEHVDDVLRERRYIDNQERRAEHVEATQGQRAFHDWTLEDGKWREL